jgi:hypothetical protein
MQNHGMQAELCRLNTHMNGLQISLFLFLSF